MAVMKDINDVCDLALAGRASRDSMLIDALPSKRMKYLDISAFSLINKSGKTVKNCGIWFVDGCFSRISPMISFEVLEDVSDISFFFFRVPNKGSKLKFDLKGSGHSGAFFSSHRMNMYCRLVGKNSHIIVGDALHIGGCTIALQNTVMTIGAGGLWSDGILVQGTDSHGIVDLDSMQIINGGAKHITIEPRVWVGRKVTLMKNITLKEGAIVATNSTVVKDVPTACVVAGVPAKVVKPRTSWCRNEESISKWETQQLSLLRERLGRENERPMAKKLTKITAVGVWQSLWLKALAAGAVGAAIFEGLSEMVVAVY